MSVRKVRCISTCHSSHLLMIHFGFYLQLDLHAASQNQLERQHAGCGFDRKTLVFCTCQLTCYPLPTLFLGGMVEKEIGPQCTWHVS